MQYFTNYAGTLRCIGQVLHNHEIEAFEINTYAKPRDFDLTVESFFIGHPRVKTCAGCREPFSPDDILSIGLTGSGKKYWFHHDCEKLWQEERHRP